MELEVVVHEEIVDSAFPRCWILSAAELSRIWWLRGLGKSFAWRQTFEHVWSNWCKGMRALWGGLAAEDLGYDFQIKMSNRDMFFQTVVGFLTHWVFLLIWNKNHLLPAQCNGHCFTTSSWSCSFSQPSICSWVLNLTSVFDCSGVMNSVALSSHQGPIESPFLNFESRDSEVFQEWRGWQWFEFIPFMGPCSVQFSSLRDSFP